MAKSKAVPKRSDPPAVNGKGGIEKPKGMNGSSKAEKAEKVASGLAQDPLLTRFLTEVVDRPHLFLLLDRNPQLPNLARNVTKVLHDLPAGSVLNKKIALGPLKELLVEGFDAEQVWEEIQLRNTPLLRSVGALLRDPKAFIEEETEEKKPKNSKNLKPVKAEEELDADEEDDDEMLEGSDDFEGSDNDADFGEEMGGDEEDEDAEFGMDEDDLLKKKKGTQKKRHPTEDGFFSLEEMEAFVKEAESAEYNDGDDDDEEEEEEEIDYFHDLPSDDDEDEELDEEGGSYSGRKKKAKKAKKAKSKPEEMKYTDFFDAPDDPATLGEDDDEDAEEQGEGEEDEVEHDENEDEEGLNQEDAGTEEEGGGEEDLGDDEEDWGDFDQEEGEEADFGRNMKKDLFDDRDLSDNEEGLSTYERNQKKVKEIIQQFETENTGAKHWTLKGEVTSKSRPVNSLLEEDMEYEHATKSVPMVTDEVTKSLEEVIKKRILDELYDDVERKYEQEFNFKPKADTELDHEKSKKSLGEIYEDEFMKQKEGGAHVDDKLEKTHRLISNMFKHLCTKLDALANAHYTPKQAKEELKVITNVPSITIEEVMPGGVSDASRLAPEEIYDRKGGELVVGESEVTQEEKQRLRATKKRTKKKEKKERALYQKMVARANPGLGNKHAKSKTLKSLQEGNSKNIIKAKETDTATKYSSSSAVFSRLQDENTKKEAAPRKSSQEAKKPKDSSQLRL